MSGIVTIAGRDPAGETGGRATRASRLSALRAAIGCLEAEIDVEAAAQEAIEVLERQLGYDNLAMLVVGDDSHSLVPLALSDQRRGREFVALDKAYVVSSNPVVGRGVTGWVAETGSSVRLDDVRDDHRYVPLRDQIRSELCVPIRSGNHVLGVINVETRRSGAFSEADQQVLEVVASRLGPVLREARSHREDDRSERLGLLGQMTGGVVHDLNNLLTAMIARTELLKQAADLPEATLEHLSELEHAHELAVSMNRGLLDFARGYPGRLSQVDVNRVVRQAQRTMQLLLPRSVIVETRLDPDLARVFAFAGDVERILLNLVQNARQAMPEGGNLVLSTANVVLHPDGRSAKLAGTYVRLAVSDDGEGMDERTRSKIFQPLYTNRPQGHGLGLSTVQRIVERYAGHIAVHSEPGTGTRFEVFLPCADGN